MNDQELAETLEELNAVLLRRFLSKKKQEKREKFYNKKIEELKEKANKHYETRK